MKTYYFLRIILKKLKTMQLKLVYCSFFILRKKALFTYTFRPSLSISFCICKVIKGSFQGKFWVLSVIRQTGQRDSQVLCCSLCKRKELDITRKNYRRNINVPVRVFVALTQAGVIRKEELQMKNCLHLIACRQDLQICGGHLPV